MKHHLLATAAGLLLGLAAVQPSSAYTIDGSVNSFNQYASSGFVSGTFSDAYSFSLTGESNVNASFTGNPGADFTLSDFAIYSGDGSTKETKAFRSAMIFDNFQAGTSTVELGPGMYFIGVTGSSSNAQGTYTGTLAVSAVPLPPSLALFGLSLAGLGAAGVIRTRRRGAPAA